MDQVKGCCTTRKKLTAAADVALAAYVKESTRYNWMGRLSK
jgi:hypothetical protein